jgi:hypothetical protein
MNSWQIWSRMGPDVMDTREHLADDALAAYDFGPDLNVVGHDGWDSSDPADFTKIVYVEGEGADPEQDSERLSFHVRFDHQGQVAEAYALCMRTGAEVGSPAPAALPSKRMHDALIKAGWEKLPSSSPDSYRRGQEVYITWSRNGVLIASTGTSIQYDSDTGVVLSAIGTGHEVTVEAVMTKIERRQGRARQALSEWVQMAKACGLTLYLEPVPLEPSISRAALISFYSSVGFKETDGSCRVMVANPT